MLATWIFKDHSCHSANLCQQLLPIEVENFDGSSDISRCLHVWNLIIYAQTIFPHLLSLSPLHSSSFPCCASIRNLIIMLFWICYTTSDDGLPWFRPLEGTFFSLNFFFHLHEYSCHYVCVYCNLFLLDIQQETFHLLSHMSFHTLTSPQNLVLKNLIFLLLLNIFSSLSLFSSIQLRFQ